MKKRFVALGGIMIVLMALSFIVPIGAFRADMETKSCPGWVCIINSANAAASGHEFEYRVFCSTATHTCAECCQDICLGAEKIIGKVKVCDCQPIAQYELGCTTK